MQKHVGKAAFVIDSCVTYTHTRTHPFYSPLDFTEARDSEWQWHYLGHMQIYTPPQTDNHASIPPLLHNFIQIVYIIYWVCLVLKFQ